MREAWMAASRMAGAMLRGAAVPLMAASAVAQVSRVPVDRLYVYVGALDSHSVTLAWGSKDAIGRSAGSGEPVEITVGNRSVTTTESWVRINGLAADREYGYSLSAGGSRRASGTIRTWPETADSLVFFVIGDWGNGSSEQRRLAERMVEERNRLEAEGKHVRFVLSTGDNLYGHFWNLFGSGDSDSDWEDKFFRPYRRILASIPFYAVLGNHDGNESDPRGDLAAYLDNFFFPVPEPARWYRFNFGGLADFFALDSTSNTLEGPPEPAFAEDGEQTHWLREQLAGPGAPWRIAFLHHPMFTAGPEHPPSLDELRHWFELFTAGGVEVVFSGHEHNFQLSERNRRTGQIQFVVSGAGGQLRDDNVRSAMRASSIAAWAPQHHFCVVELSAEEMLLTPVGLEAFTAVDPQGNPVQVPIRIPRQVQ